MDSIIIHLWSLNLIQVYAPVTIDIVLFSRSQFLLSSYARIHVVNIYNFIEQQHVECMQKKTGNKRIIEANFSKKCYCCCDRLQGLFSLLMYFIFASLISYS